MNGNTIDAVVLWVNGSDPEWIKEKNLYAGKKNDSIDSSEVRYRDWGILKYWFRAIETNMPWINRVFFITNGQVPEWLNLDSSRLRFIKHADYMPKEYLPTFNSNPIELNLHRIDDLSEKFVLFNDDMYVMNPVESGDFFQDGLPLYPAALHSIVPMGDRNEEIMNHIYINDLIVINRNFNINQLRKNWVNWFDPAKAGLRNALLSFVLSYHNGYVGFYNHHLPVPLRKSTIREVWQKEENILHTTSMNKFRSASDVNQYLFRYWELARQTFVPIREKKLGRYYVINDDVEDLKNVLSDFQGKLICLNDSDIDEICTGEKFESMKAELQKIFESKFPNKSTFEL